jgi:hypothetical protein
MAGTARVARRENGTGSEVRALREELNKVITDLETLRASLALTHTMLDADSVGSADYASSNTAVDAAGDMTAATVNA